MPGVTDFQFRLLQFVFRNGSLYGHGDTARMLSTNNPNLSRSVRLLRQRGLLSREYPYELTDKGRASLRP